LIKTVRQDNSVSQCTLERGIREVEDEIVDSESSTLCAQQVVVRPHHLLTQGNPSGKTLASSISTILAGTPDAAIEFDESLTATAEHAADDLAGFYFSPASTDSTPPTSPESIAMTKSPDFAIPDESEESSHGSRALRRIRAVIDDATTALKQHVGKRSEVDSDEGTEGMGSCNAIGTGISRPGTPGKAL
jgi:hypothetical protein